MVYHTSMDVFVARAHWGLKDAGDITSKAEKSPPWLCIETETRTAAVPFAPACSAKYQPIALAVWTCSCGVPAIARLTVVVSVPSVPVVVVLLGKPGSVIEELDIVLVGHVPGLCESSKNIVVDALQIKSFSGTPSVVRTPKSP